MLQFLFAEEMARTSLSDADVASIESLPGEMLAWIPWYSAVMV